MSRAVYVHRPGHPLADEWNMVDTRDLGDWQEKPETLPVVIDRHYWGAKVVGTGEDIGSRAKHREYMHRNNLTTTDDFTQTWAKAEKERADRQAGKFPDARERREEVGRIAYEVEKKNARRR